MKILHTADLHLDSPFDGLSPKKAASRRSEQRTLLGRIVEVAEKESVDAVLLSGDLLDSDVSYYETGEELLKCVRAISAPVFISPGNHDFYSSRSPYARLDFPGNVHIFKTDVIDCVELPNLGFRVFGAAFTDTLSSPLLEGFHAYRDDGMLNVMCIHGEPGKTSSRYNSVTEDQIAGSGMHYIGFGHNHKSSGLKKAGQTWYSIPGCPEGRGFDETGRKTINIVDLEETGCTIREVSVALRNYEVLKVDVSSADPFLAVQLALPDDTITDIYRVVLTGECESGIDIEELYQRLKEYFYDLRIQDSTHVTRNIWENACTDTLKGLFISRMRKKYDAASGADEKLKIEQAVRWGLTALDNGEEIARHED